MAQITEIIMTAYERLQKLITDGDIYTKSQLDEKLDEIETKFGTEVAAAVQTKIDDGSLASLTIGNGTITTEKMVDGAIKGKKKYRSYGVIIQNNAISIYMATKTVVVNKNTQVYLDNSAPTVATAGTELTYTALYDIALYVDLTDNTLKVGDIKSIPNAHLLLATVNLGSGACCFLGNENSIALYNSSGLRLYDTKKNSVIGAIGNKVNVAISSLTLSLELTDVSTTRVFAEGMMYTVSSTEGVTVTDLTNPIQMLFNTTTKILFLKSAVNANSNSYASDNNNIVHICTFVPSTGIIKRMDAGSIHNVFIDNKDYFESVDVANTAVLNTNVDTSFPYTSYGMDVEKAAAKKPNVFNTSLVAEGGMLVSIAGKNANWNQQYVNSTWGPGYDGGNGGHALQCYAKNKQYRMTGILDIRRTDNKLPMASFFNWIPGLNKFGWLRLGCDDYGKYTNNSNGTRYGGIEVCDVISRINTVNIMQANPYETYLPQDYEIDDTGAFALDESNNKIERVRVPLTNYNVFQVNPLNKLTYKEKGEDTYKYVALLDDLEKELMALTTLHNATLNIENNTIALPNHKRNKIVVDNGLIKKIKQISKYTLTGTENWSLKTAGTGANIFACTSLSMDNFIGDYGNSNTNMLSSIGACRYTTSATLQEGETIVLMGRTSNLKGWQILISKALATDVASLKTYLASNNITIYYQIETEVLEEIS